MTADRPRVELQVVDDPDAAADVVALLLVDAVRAGASIALSGGTTPRAAYERAAALEPDWGAARLWLVDERCVPPDDPLANQRLVREAILDRIAVQPRWHPVATVVGAERAADRYEAELRAEGLPRVVLLGIGADGHTASLFPGSPALQERTRLAVAADAGLEPFVRRITLTLAALAAATDVVFLVTGEEKAEQVRRAFAADPSASTPASLVRSAAGRTRAVLDAAAAGRL
jgi:6-phosphogluconolactonase